MRPRYLLSWPLFLAPLAPFLLGTVVQQADAFGKPRPSPALEVDGDDDDIIPTTPESVAMRDEQLTLAGKVAPVLTRFIITGEKARDIIRALQDALNEQEFFLIGLIGWGWFPLNKAIFNFMEQRKVNVSPVIIDDDAGDGSNADATSTNAEMTTEVKKFEEGTYWYQSAKHISQAARIGAFVYSVDCVAIILNTIGFRYKQQAGFSKKAAHISFSVWIALRIGEVKRWMLRKAFHKENGKVQVYDSILNVIVGTVTFGHVLDLFDINIGVALASLLSIGGVGTLVLSLASKDIATELVSGLAVSASDRFLPGDVSTNPISCFVFSVVHDLSFLIYFLFHPIFSTPMCQ